MASINNAINNKLQPGFFVGATQVTATGIQLNYLSTATGVSGTGLVVLNNSPAITTPRIGQINDTNGNAILNFAPVASAVNYIQIVNNSTTNPPALLSVGSDTNVGMVLQTQAAGVFTANTTASVNAWTFATGTAYQHLTQLQFSNTSATRSVTFPDQSGTLLLSGNSAYISSILDSNGNINLSFGNVVSAVNYLQMVNASTTNVPSIQSMGSDTNISIALLSKGDGGIAIKTAAVSATPLQIYSGTTSQHLTNFLFANTANTRNVTFPDASGTVLYAAGSGGLKSFQIFTTGTAQTYTTPVGITSILIEAVGGGGGGGGCLGAASSTGAGAGGGAGSYARLYVANASSTYTYTIGAGGAGGTAGNNAGSTGGTTTFSASSLSCVGGAGGSGSTSTLNASGANAHVGGAGGTATNGNVNIVGGAGGGSFIALGAILSGQGGSSYFGGGGAGLSNVGTGNAGNSYGSGGSGGGCTSVSQAGGAGQGGIIIVWEFS